ncbi:Riboflavin synthase [Planctopirus ephydatiae]|uniref:Riboflavin synthase n=1 Tax=Planctopirus ephydatiae TaxID=2528019 RepID=A0A518GS86_9PLAN|nr:riboflavin synthase [Planctopirus ephydatiae]QDV31431.1 Riboflavin synthase [Planctopirus ephydatiae]
MQDTRSGEVGMFTGLVEGMGQIEAVVSEPGGVRIVVSPPVQMLLPEDPAVLGESVAINGCCLTVVELQNQGNPTEKWSFQAGSETLSKTNLGALTSGASVNLERAMKANARFGGHIVQGHVDGTARILSIDHEAEWVFMAFALTPELARQLVPKGSVTVDGVSLTVVEAKRDGFSVALIPHTLKETTLGQRQVGDTVNIETDILGKYVERLMAGR